jgi:hypothetical protein
MLFPNWQFYAIFTEATLGQLAHMHALLQYTTWPVGLHVCMAALVQL